MRCLKLDLVALGNIVGNPSHRAEIFVSLLEADWRWHAGPRDRRLGKFSL